MDVPVFKAIQPEVSSSLVILVIILYVFYIYNEKNYISE